MGKTFSKLMTTCLIFAQQIAKFANQAKVDEEMMTLATRTNHHNHTKSSNHLKRINKENTRQNNAGWRNTEAKNARGHDGGKTQQSGHSVDKGALRRTRVKVQSEHLRQVVSTSSYRDIILRSQTRFDTILTEFMESLVQEAARGEYHSHLTNLCTRLDFNSYYKK